MELWNALDAIKSSDRLDTDGLTPNSLRIMGFACAENVLQIVRLILASRELVRGFTINGQMKGKTSSRTSKRDIRAILPLPSILCLCDCILAMKIEVYILAIEKGLDHNDEAAAAVADIKSYYDSLSPLLIVQWMLQRRVPEILCTAFLRVHVEPQIRICFDR